MSCVKTESIECIDPFIIQSERENKNKLVRYEKERRWAITTIDQFVAFVFLCLEEPHEAIRAKSAIVVVGNFLFAKLTDSKKKKRPNQPTSGFNITTDELSRCDKEPVFCCCRWLFPSFRNRSPARLIQKKAMPTQNKPTWRSFISCASIILLNIAILIGFVFRYSWEIWKMNTGSDCNGCLVFDKDSFYQNEEVVVFLTNNNNYWWWIRLRFHWNAERHQSLPSGSKVQLVENRPLAFLGESRNIREWRHHFWFLR